MRIAIASSGLGHVARGIESWAADLGAALHDRGADVLLCKGGGEATKPYERVVPCWTREGAQARRLARILPRRLSWRVGLGNNYEIEQTTFAWRLLRLLRRERVDILHVQDPHVALLLQRAHETGLSPARVILAHGTEERLEFLGKIAYLQHLAPWHAEEAREAGVWREKWTTIPNFIDVENFRPRGPGEPSAIREELGIPADATVALTAAAIKRHHKRIDYLLAEFAQTLATPAGQNAWLIVAGGWEKETDELIQEGTRLCGDRVRFLVRFPRGRMGELYRSADLFVMTSLKEMMPIALIEACASGLPCLVHRHPVMEWMIGPGGSCVDMATPGGLNSALSDWLPDATRRVQAGLAAREHALSHFSRDRVVDQILEYYQLVLHLDETVSANATLSTVGRPTASGA